MSGSDLPYILAVQLFIGKDLIMDSTDDVDYAKQLVLGSFIRDRLGDHCEWSSRLLEKDAEIRGLRYEGYGLLLTEGESCSSRQGLLPQVQVCEGRRS